MSKNVATFNASFGIKESIESDIANIKAKIDRGMPIVKQALVDPVKEADRQIGLIGRSLEKIMDKSIKSIVSDRELQKLDQIQQKIEKLFKSLETIPQSLPLSQTLDKLNTLREGTVQTQALGHMGSLSSSGPSSSMGLQLAQFDSQRTMLLNSMFQTNALLKQAGSVVGYSNAGSRFNAIRDFEVLGAATRPGFTRETADTRQQRILEEQHPAWRRSNPKEYARLWEKNLVAREPEMDLDAMFSQRNFTQQHAQQLIQSFSEQQFRQQLASKYNRNMEYPTPPPQKESIRDLLARGYPDVSTMYPPDWSPITSVKHGVRYVPNEMLQNPRAQGGIGAVPQRHLDQLRQWREARRAEFAGDIFQQEAYVARNNLSVDQRGNIIDDATDLNAPGGYFGPASGQVRFGKWSGGPGVQYLQGDLVSGFAKRVIRKHREDQFTQSETEQHEAYQRQMRGDLPIDRSYSNTGLGLTKDLKLDDQRNKRRELLQTEKELVSAYTAQDRAVEKVAARIAQMTDAEKRSLGNRLRAAEESGRNVVTSRRAFEQATDPNSKFATGKFAHSLRYGIQNFGFGVEDFMIASQYGGPKAGFRAIANNLTAIAGAASSGLGPWASGGAILGTAVVSAGIPMFIDQWDRMHGTSDEDMDRARQMGGMSQYADRGFSFKRRVDSLTGSDSRGLSAQIRSARDDQTDTERRRGYLASRLSPDTVRLANQNVSGYERSLAHIARFRHYATFGMMPDRPDDVSRELLLQPFLPMISGWAGHSAGEGWYKTRGNRNLTQISDIDRAREAYNQNNKELLALGPDSQVVSQQIEKLQTERKASRGYELASYTGSLAESVGSARLEMRGLDGELVSPQEGYELRQERRRKQRALNKHRFRKQPEMYEDSEAAIQQEDEADRTQLMVDLAKHKRSLFQRDMTFREQKASFISDPNLRSREEFEIQRARLKESNFFTPSQKEQLLKGLEQQEANAQLRQDFSFRAGQNNLETNPRKRMESQLALEKDIINASDDLTQAQKTARIAALDKNYKFQMGLMTQANTLGSSIESGSSEDVRLRLRYFSKDSSTKANEEGNKTLKELLLEFRGLRNDLRGKKQKVANIL